MYMYMCMHIHIWIYKCIYMHICIYIYIYTCICIYIYGSTNAHICIYVFIYTYTHVYIYICVYIYINVYLYIYIHSCIHKCMYIHAYVYAGITHRYVYIFSPPMLMGFYAHGFLRAGCSARGHGCRPEENNRQEECQNRRAPRQAASGPCGSQCSGSRYVRIAVHVCVRACVRKH